MSKIKPVNVKLVAVGSVNVGKSYLKRPSFDRITPKFFDDGEFIRFIRNIDKQITHVKVDILCSSRYEYKNLKQPLFQMINGKLIRTSFYYQTSKHFIQIIITVFVHNVKKEFYLYNLDNRDITLELISQIKSWLFLRKYEK